MKASSLRRNAKKCIKRLQKRALTGGLDGTLLDQYNYISNYSATSQKFTSNKILLVVFVFLCILLLSCSAVNSFLGTRCLLPSNYLVWEATRPLADCSYCINVTKPIILRNITRKEFVVRIHCYNYIIGSILDDLCSLMVNTGYNHS